MNRSDMLKTPTSEIQMNDNADFKKFGKIPEEPPIQIPPDPQKRTFNENDILGNFDRDEKGNPIILRDKNGNPVDKDGNKVNEKGYLVDDKGNIIDNQHKEKMFDKSELTDKGEVPAPFCVEKHNFNPHNIRGDFNQDKTGKPLI